MVPQSRREFLASTTLGSLASLASPRFAAAAMAGADSVVASPEHAALRSLAPGDVAPDGWLRLYLRKQANQLGRHLPEVSWPFTGAFWTGEDIAAGATGSWWPWEQKAYWIDGALRCALLLGDQALLSAALESIDHTLSHADGDGYLGASFWRDAELRRPDRGNFRWPHTVFFRARPAGNRHR